MSDVIIPCPNCGVKNRIPGDKIHLNPKCGRCGHVFEGSASASVIDLDDNTFDKVIGDSTFPVMVDFYSPTCGPCQMLAPVVNSLASQYAGKAVIAKYDTSRYQTAAARFGIRGVPTLIFFKHGQVIDQVVGAVSQEDIAQRLNNLL